jgi:cellulose synthase/poly-beta-1,6-N-acetylglucosamine synthase-like glycosyltransferase
MPINCSMGIMAHNEEGNIGQLLDALVSQRLKSVVLTEIVVVASGCTDRTEAIVLDRAKRDPRIHLITQEKRAGKAVAINEYLPQAQERVIVLCSADLLPEPDALERLVIPFADSEVGMTTSHPVPVNDARKFMGFAAHMLWGLHHKINLTSFKSGEMIAFRKIFERIPYHTAVDEASIEPVVRGQGYGVKYVADAIVHNKGPETVSDFLRQRRRIYSGHLAVRDTLGYTVSTMNARKIFRIMLRNLDWRPRQFVWSWSIVGLEAYGRLLGLRDYKKRRNHAVWEIATSTKQLEMAASAKGIPKI